jgi:hypothetical protein
MGIGTKRDCPLQQPETFEKPFYQWSDTESGGGVTHEYLADANVLGEHLC